MIICADCLAEQYPGTLFCSECGSYLRQKAAPTATLSPTSAPSPTATPLKIRLRFPDQRELQITLNKQLLLGRADSETGVRPDVDLTPHFGMELGVSRLHAALQQGPGGVMLIDKSSTNGTYINNYQLVPEKPYLLGQGDQITLGSLEITVYFD